MKPFIKNSLYFIAVTIMFILAIVYKSAWKEKTAKRIHDKYIPSCKHFINYGETFICLPEIEGMKECYSLPNVKAKADSFEYKENSILGFYLNEYYYQQVNVINEIKLDDYFKIYVVKNTEDTNINESDLNRLAKSTESMLKRRWDVLTNKLDEIKYFGSLDEPILIDSYTPNKDARSFLVFMKYRSDSETIFVAGLNLINIKNRLIYLAYYKVYENEKSFHTARAKNDYLVLKLLDENK